jgi:hypothetical protein
MKKTFNSWIVQILLTAVTSFLFNGGAFSENTAVIPQNGGGIAVIEPSAQPSAATLVRPAIRPKVHHYLRKGYRGAFHPQHARLGNPGSVTLS